jgi:hypothetical protein
MHIAPSFPWIPESQVLKDIFACVRDSHAECLSLAGVALDLLKSDGDTMSIADHRDYVYAVLMEIWALILKACLPKALHRLKVVKERRIRDAGLHSRFYDKWKRFRYDEVLNFRFDSSRTGYYNDSTLFSVSGLKTIASIYNYRRTYIKEDDVLRGPRRAPGRKRQFESLLDAKLRSLRYTGILELYLADLYNLGVTEDIMLQADDVDVKQPHTWCFDLRGGGSLWRSAYYGSGSRWNPGAIPTTAPLGASSVMGELHWICLEPHYRACPSAFRYLDAMRYTILSLPAEEIGVLIAWISLLDPMQFYSYLHNDADNCSNLIDLIWGWASIDLD